MAAVCVLLLINSQASGSELLESFLKNAEAVIKIKCVLMNYRTILEPSENHLVSVVLG